MLTLNRLIWNHADWQDQQGPGSTTAADVYQDLVNLQQHTINYCERIWVIVKDVLCNDSPEGLVLEDMEDVNTVDTKDVLSYSFRAVHASRQVEVHRILDYGLRLILGLIAISCAVWSRDCPEAKETNFSPFHASEK